MNNTNNTVMILNDGIIVTIPQPGLFAVLDLQFNKKSYFYRFLADQLTLYQNFKLPDVLELTVFKHLLSHCMTESHTIFG